MEEFLKMKPNIKVTPIGKKHQQSQAQPEQIQQLSTPSMHPPSLGATQQQQQQPVFSFQGSNLVAQPMNPMGTIQNQDFLNSIMQAFGIQVKIHHDIIKHTTK